MDLESGCPDQGGYRNTRLDVWQKQCMTILKSKLADEASVELRQPSLTTYTTPTWEVVQVWYDIWRLHVQCEFQVKKRQANGVVHASDEIKISLDFEEREPGEYLSDDDMESLREAIRSRITSLVKSELGGQPEVVSRGKKTEHIVQEQMSFTDPDEDVESVAKRLCQYVKTLMPAARLAVNQWVQDH